MKCAHRARTTTATSPGVRCSLREINDDRLTPLFDSCCASYESPSRGASSYTSPDVWVSRWCIVLRLLARRFSFAVIIESLSDSGMCLDTGSLQIEPPVFNRVLASLPPTLVIGFVIDAIRKIVSVFIRHSGFRSAIPAAGQLKERSSRRCTTGIPTPGTSPESTRWSHC